MRIFAARWEYEHPDFTDRKHGQWTVWRVFEHADEDGVVEENTLLDSNEDIALFPEKPQAEHIFAAMLAGASWDTYEAEKLDDWEHATQCYRYKGWNVVEAYEIKIPQEVTP